MSGIAGERLSLAGAAAAVAGDARPGARYQSFLDRRLAAHRLADRMVASGQWASPQAHAFLARHGFVPGGVSAKQPPGWMVPGLQTIGDVAQTVHDAPRGAYGSAKAIGLDLRDVGERGINTADRLEGRPQVFKVAPGAPFRRTRGLGRAVGHAVAQDFEHPLRHPGYTLLDVLGGAGGYAKLARAGGSVLREAPTIARDVRALPQALRDVRTARAAGLSSADFDQLNASEQAQLREAARPKVSPGQRIIDLHKQALSPATMKRVGRGYLRANAKTAKLLGRRVAPVARSFTGNVDLLRIEQAREQAREQTYAHALSRLR